MPANLLLDLDRFLSEVTHEAGKRHPADERRSAANVAGDYASRLQDRSIFRRLLSDDALDAVRFRFWCKHAGVDPDLRRKAIDDLIIKESLK